MAETGRGVHGLRDSHSARECCAALVLEIFLLAAFSLYITIRGYGQLSGDSSIYFTFLKNFFHLPYSYADGVVSYGATSLLYVPIYSLIYHLFGTYWLLGLKLFSAGLLAGAVWLLNRAAGGNACTLPVGLAVILRCDDIVVYTVQCYETGLVFFSLAGLLYLLSVGRRRAAIFVSGLLYLVRPELAAVSVVVDLYLLAREKESRKLVFRWILLSFIPAAVIVSYMAVATGSLLPSSVTGRAITALETSLPWVQRLHAATDIILRTWGKFIWFTAFSCALFIVCRKRLPMTVLLLLLGILLPHLAVPTPRYALRYLSPLAVFFVLAVCYLLAEAMRALSPGLQSWPWLRYSIPFIFSLILLLSSVRYFHGALIPSYGTSERLDILMGRDLAEVMAGAADPSRPALAYEIQAQYYVKNRLYSLDAIVGDELTDFLLRKEPLSTVIRRENIGYLITMNSFNYRSIYDDTELETIYTFDQSAEVGDMIEIDGLSYRKIAQNPAATQDYPYDPLNNGDGSVNVFTADDPYWPNSHLFWNAVYSID